MRDKLLLRYFVIVVITLCVGAITIPSIAQYYDVSQIKTKYEYQPPVASFIWTPTNTLPEQEITFNAATSYDPSGTITSYDWDFGDSMTATGEIVTHTFSKEGTYNVTLTVTNNNSLTDARVKKIEIGESYINRERMIEIADAYTHFEWHPTSANIYHDLWYAQQVDTPDRDTYTFWPDWRGWKSDQLNIGVPYQWGGFSSIPGFNFANPEDFEDQYTGLGFFSNQIHFAGDIYTQKPTQCNRACGVDCSGFVSRCWNGPRLTTTTFTYDRYTDKITFENITQGDILDKAAGHVLLFNEFINPEKTRFTLYEAGHDFKVNIREYEVVNPEPNADTIEVIRVEDQMHFIYTLYSYDLVNAINIKGGIAAVKMEIKNLGDRPYTDVQWNISATIGFLRRFSYTEGIISSIPEKQSQQVGLNPILGFGPIEITGKATVTDLGIVKITWHGFVFGFFVIVFPNT